jgi:hypothetical protein
MVSWTFFCDIAGRVSKQYKSSWLSVNAVAIPSQSVSEVRSELLGCFEGKPPKWRDSASQDLKLVASFIETKALPWVTVHVHRTEPAWGKFWESGKAFHDKLTQTMRGKAGFPKPATVIRYLLFSIAVTSLIRICVREFGVGSIVDPHGLLPLSLQLVFDADIADPESRELFAEMYDQWQRTTRFRSELTIAPEVHVHFSFCLTSLLELSERDFWPQGGSRQVCARISLMWRKS